VGDFASLVIVFQCGERFRPQRHASGPVAARPDKIQPTILST
jgi:hypothetical protein